MKKSNCTKSFFCHLKPNKSLGSPDFGSPVIWLLTVPGRYPSVLGPASLLHKSTRACQPRPWLATIINAKSQCKKVSSEQELGRLCLKAEEGAGCECQGTIGFHFLMCAKGPFLSGTLRPWMKKTLGGMHLRLMMRSKIQFQFFLTSQKKKKCQILTSTPSTFSCS